MASAHHRRARGDHVVRAGDGLVKTNRAIGTDQLTDASDITVKTAQFVQALSQAGRLAQLLLGRIARRGGASSYHAPVRTPPLW